MTSLSSPVLALLHSTYWCGFRRWLPPPARQATWPREKSRSKFLTPVVFPIFRGKNDIIVQGHTLWTHLPLWPPYSMLHISHFCNSSVWGGCQSPRVQPEAPRGSVTCPQHTVSETSEFPPSLSDFQPVCSVIAPPYSNPGVSRAGVGTA